MEQFKPLHYKQDALGIVDVHLEVVAQVDGDGGGLYVALFVGSHPHAAALAVLRYLAHHVQENRFIYVMIEKVMLHALVHHLVHLL